MFSPDRKRTAQRIEKKNPFAIPEGVGGRARNETSLKGEIKS